MVPKSVAVALSILLTMVDRSLALSCIPCSEVDCGPTPTCSYEVTKSICGCCNVCAKGPGEECGGPWGLSGTCSLGLECQLDPNMPGSDFNKDGICVENVQRDPCALPPETFCTKAVVCGSDGITYSNGCTFIEAKCRNPELKQAYCANGLDCMALAGNPVAQIYLLLGGSQMAQRCFPLWQSTLKMLEA
ncbi:unnamed protein product [Meganyctiphanes norvegica]|uniref:IGFBP N-terminal domain-containing protein n=1 Tax=Meganyctiphanes norvegica TaxID=48144 RepID=A0AAV2SB83_MEGNR